MFPMMKRAIVFLFLAGTFGAMAALFTDALSGNARVSPMDYGGTVFAHSHFALWGESSNSHGFAIVIRWIAIVTSLAGILLSLLSTRIGKIPTEVCAIIIAVLFAMMIVEGNLLGVVPLLLQAAAIVML